MVAEATARQAASFVLGAAAALTVVMLVQYRAPAVGLSRARTQGQFSGWRSLDHRRLNGTTGLTDHQAPVVVAGEGHHAHHANATLKANSTRTRASHLPIADHKEEVRSTHSAFYPFLLAMHGKFRLLFSNYIRPTSHGLPLNLTNPTSLLIQLTISTSSE
jgi:hypothetical protein